MKKNILLLSFLITGFFSFAQNPLLLDKIWQIEKITLGGNPIDAPAEPEAFFIDFNNVFSSFAFKTTVCSTIYGPATYTSNNDEFTITNILTQNESCSNSSLTDFQTLYFLFFSKNSTVLNKFNYNVTSTDTGYKLVLTNASGDISDFKFVRTPEILTSKTWMLESLNLEGIFYEKPSEWYGGRTTFGTNGEFDTSYFNSSQGSIAPLANQNFKLLGTSTTLAQHESAAVNNFDNKYHGSFLQNPANNWRPHHFYTYTISNNGKTLVITNSKGDFATYNELQLATNETGKSSVKIYPNPVRDILNISGSEKINSFVITDSSGKLKMKKLINGEKQTSLKIKNLPAGIYFLMLNDKETYKIIKQ